MFETTDDIILMSVNLLVTEYLHATVNKTVFVSILLHNLHEKDMKHIQRMFQ